ncbi:hypothetical protein [Weissella cibaria]|jgi:hypothetical protein|uniref:DNA-binding protein n=1 Tax=Weissella cibaria TaxID=137591 RepID=A0A2S1KQQ3_9LACO|nr:hypothetical protein [Weissella cibaria]AWF95349.1 hypothetical protein B6254_0942 [Weissella cibaria]
MAKPVPTFDVNDKLLINADEAAGLLSVSRTYFDERVRYEKRFVSMKIERIPRRYSRHLLQKWSDWE